MIGALNLRPKPTGREGGQTDLTPGSGVVLTENEPEATVRERYWTEFEGAQRFGARMTVLPGRYFPDDPPEEPRTLGRGVTCLDVFLASHCAGMREVPRHADVTEALMIEKPDRGHRILVRVLVEYFPASELLMAQKAKAFRWRDLARAARRTGHAWCRNGWWINQGRTEKVGPDTRGGWTAEQWYNIIRKGLQDSYSE